MPLKGGLILEKKLIVLTHPSGSAYKGFTATCTHMGCVVYDVSKNTITCPCHGSQYSAIDGHVTRGPAVDPLAAKNIVVQDGKIYLV